MLQARLVRLFGGTVVTISFILTPFIQFIIEYLNNILIKQIKEF